MGASRDDYTHVDHAKIKEQTKIVQIAIIERIFVVPLDLKCNPVLVAVDLVGWGFNFLLVNFDRGIKLCFSPSTLPDWMKF